MIKFLLILALFLSVARAELLPAHSHNDYEQPRPLHAALELGYRSIEADVFFTNNLLMVAHEPKHLDPNRTLTSLYLDPLLKSKSTNQIILLVDFKTDAEPTYQALKKILPAYKSILTEYNNGKIIPRRVSLIISGNRPRQTLETEKIRYAAMDGRFQDLGQKSPNHLIPLISDNWTKFFQWRGDVSLPAEEKQKLRNLVTQAHAENKLIRFWATPDLELVWKELHAAKADLINVDDLEKFAQWHRKQRN